MNVAFAVLIIVWLLIMAVGIILGVFKDSDYFAPFFVLGMTILVYGIAILIAIQLLIL